MDKKHRTNQINLRFPSSALCKPVRCYGFTFRDCILPLGAPVSLSPVPFLSLCCSPLLSWPSWSHTPPSFPSRQPTCLHRSPTGLHLRTTMRRPFPWGLASPPSTSAPTVSSRPLGVKGNGVQAPLLKFQAWHPPSHALLLRSCPTTWPL